MATNGDIDSQSPNDNLNQPGKNLLDNVSLMTTTLSPLPSQESSLQRGMGSGALNTEDGTNFLGKVRNKMAADKITEEHEKSNISTLTAFEDQLHELQGITSTAISSTPAMTMDQRLTGVDTAEVLYGFDLSPAHSVEKQPGHEAGGEQDGCDKVMYGFDLSPVHSYERTEHAKNVLDPDKVESVDLSSSFQNKFQSRKTESRAAPNFMQAKVASPRHLRSEKTSLNEDTETMMSQVFSSQDPTSSANGLPKTRSAATAPSHQKSPDKPAKRKGRSPSAQVKRSHDKAVDRLLQQKDPFASKANQQDYSYHSRSPKTPAKLATAKGRLGSKQVATKRADPITPKSPKSRQTTIKVTKKIKSSPNVRSKRQSPPRGMTKTVSHQVGLGNTKSSFTSMAHSEIDASLRDVSPERTPRHKGRMSSPDSGVLLQMVQDLDLMRSQLRQVQEKLEAVSHEKEELIKDSKLKKEENEELRKDNFVMKSKIAHLTSSHPIEMKHDAPAVLKQDGNGQKSPSEPEISKLKQEIAAQERLIHGYQQENERIYAELKKAKASNAETEHAMYEENLRLKSEIANLQEAVDRGTQIINARKDDERRAFDLESFSPRSNPEQTDAAKKRLTYLEHQVKTEEGFRKKSEAAVKLLTEKRDQVEKEMRVSLYKRDETIEKLKQDHKIEAQSLQSKLDEAQRLLNARENNGKNDATHHKISTVHTRPSKSLLSHFQQRVAKLEEDLEKRDSSANRAVRSVQEEYNTVKMKYEERINDLEKQIKGFRANSKLNHLAELESLRTSNEALKNQLSETLAELRKESDSWKTEKDALTSKIRHLQLEKKTSTTKHQGKTKAYAELENRCRSREAEVERLSALLQEARQSLAKNSALSLRNKKSARGEKKVSEEITYNPSSFEGGGYAGLLEQNAGMKKQLENLSIELQHNKVINDALVIKLEQEAKTMREKYEKKVAFMRQKQSEAESLFNQDNVRSDLLQHQISALEQELDKCKAQVLQLRGEKEETVVLRIREQALQVQVQQLLSELHQAKTSQQSSRKVTFLEDKLRILEEQFRIKEEAFKDAVVNNSNLVIQSEFKKLQKQLDAKNKQLSRFQMELDSILLVLNELQSQGIKIPLPPYLQSIF